MIVLLYLFLCWEVQSKKISKGKKIDKTAMENAQLYLVYVFMLLYTILILIWIFKGNKSNGRSISCPSHLQSVVVVVVDFCRLCVFCSLHFSFLPSFPSTIYCEIVLINQCDCETWQTNKKSKWGEQKEK